LVDRMAVTCQIRRDTLIVLLGVFPAPPRLCGEGLG
jgi:hypothetical protein